MKSFKVTVYNPRGKDYSQSFSRGIKTLSDSMHPPVNYHAYAACTKGEFVRTIDEAISFKKPVILLINNHVKRCLNKLILLKQHNLQVAVSLKEAGTQQFSERFSCPYRLRILKEILNRSDGVISPTRAMLPVFNSLTNKPIQFIPTPYPIHSQEWNSLRNKDSKEGIFIGTRELKILSRNHLSTLVIVASYAKENNVKIGLINESGHKLKKLIKILDLSDNQVEIRSRLKYRDYLNFVSSFRVCFQLDESSVPGQVAGDCLLCGMPCVGGNGIVEQLAFPEYSGKFHKRYELIEKLKQIMLDDELYNDVVRKSLSLAEKELSFNVVAQKLENFFKEL